MTKRTIESDGLDDLPRRSMTREQLDAKIREWLRSSVALDVVCGSCDNAAELRIALQDVIRRAQQVLAEVPDE